MRSRVQFALLFGLALALAQPTAADEVATRTDTPSGLPVPRFVSLKFGKTICRIGPSFEHPTAYTYMRLGLPVRITAETRDHWRRIEDFEGARCWAHQSTLVAVNHAVVAHSVELRKSPRQSAPVLARLDRGVVARLEKSRPGWRRISVGEVAGWTPDEALWGAK
ncbi:MAG: SH3 domain-containing protein [Parvularculaceae bacterium]